MGGKNRRELVSWRINKLPDSEQLNDWVNAQSNVQNSITSLVRHMIEQFGYRDITQHDIQRILFQKPLVDELKFVLSELKGAPLSVLSENESSSAIPVTEVEHITESEIRNSDKHKNANDDIYGMIDKTSL
ncbi:hypothetical protein J2W91_004626 [Paenibacillus amylolyticus]|uniref:Uncharacterized protein n=1 Tax=Paenibacillus amylolyticus TaxID=1451 RepID=A0AAP5H4C2_PAEAM|nr:hypothetical protein [Paenibacillus amylolyticus]MDR6726120.1 hypothetical protein [Paenibacillus amylolyticus]